MHLQNTPPIELFPIADTEQSWQWLEPGGPVDFTATLNGAAWSAEIAIYRCGCEVYRAPVALDAMGYVKATIPAHVAQSLQSPARIDATYQVFFTSPIPDMDTVWVGGVAVHEVQP